MNVIVFALRGCPVAALGPYGNEWIATPNLDRLAAEGVVFDRHVSDCPDPTAAGRAWRTGRHQTPPLPPSLLGGEGRSLLPPSPLGGEGRGGGYQASTDQEASPSPVRPTPHPNPPPQGGREQEGHPPLSGEREQVSDLLAVLKARDVRTVLVRNTRAENDAHADFYAGWDEMFDARPDPADRSPTDALLRALPTVLDRLAGSADWFLWVEIDRLLPPWDVRQDVFDVYVQDLIESDEDIPEDEDAVIEDGSEYADDYGPEVEDSGWEGEAPAEPEAPEARQEPRPPDATPGGDFPAPEDDTTDEDEPELGEPVAEPVQPWADPPTGWFDKDDLASWELLHRSFAAVVTVFDADLGRVFELLRARGLDRSAAWVLTADCGLPLGEHGLIGPHRPWLYEELIHVPLIVRLPDSAEAGRRVPALTQPADLTPTLAAWLGAEGISAAHGVSLIPLLSGQAETVRPFACSGLVLGEAGEWAIRTPEWALLLPARPHPDDEERREPMLFEKPDDRWEVNDLRPRNLERADELEAMLRQAVEGIA